MQEQALRSQRLEAVGQLTGGIAHDFNNLLGVIMGNAELLNSSPDAQEDLDAAGKAIRRAVERGAALTSRLLAFSRQQTLMPATTDIGDRTDGLADMLHRALGETVALTITHEPALWPAMIDAGQYDHVLLNLAINARDAMPQGGSLTIRTRNVTLDDTDAAQHEEFAPGDYILVMVSDTGTGMPPEVAERAFEPFFTTKEVGAGSGLGLSMTYGFAKQSKGHVALDSRPGKGTTIMLYLPRSPHKVRRTTDRNITEDTELATETVLVVEDNVDVRRISVNTLRQHGYSVFEAENGKEALRHLKGSQTFDLLFTDLILPGGMNGVEIAEEARQLQPGIKVLFTTGYAENAVMHDGQLDSATTLILKPYRRAELLKRIRSALKTATD